MNKQTEPEERVNAWFLAEFWAWAMVLLVPLLTWVNGPSVSTDQFVVRVSVFVVAIVGALGISVRRLVCRRRVARE